MSQENLILGRRHTRVTAKDVRRANRGAVLRPLFMDGPLNRVLLAQLTGLSSASVTSVVSDLLEEGLIIENGLEESDGGRPRVSLRVNPDYGLVIGVDVGETGISVEAFDLSMTLVSGATVSLHPQDHPADIVIEHIAEAINGLRRELENGIRPILGVGVAMPGVVKQEQEVLVHAPNIGWSAVPLVRLLTERVDLPVYAENGAKTLGQAEMWIGAGRNVQHAVVTLWGTGVGAAIFTNGSIFRGVGSSAGEWGHTSIVAGGRSCRCGGAGCLEAYIGPEALLEEWDRTDDSFSLPANHDEEEWIDRLLAAGPSNPAAALVLERAATNFGIAAANLANLFDPELIVISGWVGLKLGPTLLPKIREALAGQALGYTERHVSVELGQLGHDAVALGASTLVVEQLLSSGGTKFRRLRLSA